MDARLDPSSAYGLSLGEINVIRNAGGSAQDALRSILISNHLIGTREVYVIKHTHCGLLGANNEMARAAVNQNLRGHATEELEKIDFLPIANLADAVKEDVDFLRGHKLMLQGVKISGWIHDTDTGKIKLVVN